jgi:hypothetical protein
MNRLDMKRWPRVPNGAQADSADDGPTFLQVQEANDRRAQAPRSACALQDR